MRALLAALALGAAAFAVPASGATAVDTTGTVYSTDKVVVPITFPVIGAASYGDSFLSCRSGCTRKHMGQDLMGPKMSPLVAACTGTVVTLKRETTVGDGNYVGIACDTGPAAGWTAMYLHVNNDTPGTDDGKGTEKWSFPSGIAEGVRVLQGQLVGWRGDSGNAESTGPHLHFELRKGSGWGGVVYNAFPSLKAATHLHAPAASGPHPDGSLLLSPSGGWNLLKDGNRYAVSPRTFVANAISRSTALRASWAELALYPSKGPLPLASGALVSDPTGQVWRITGSTRFPTIALPGQQVTAVEAADLVPDQVVDAPQTPYVPGVLVRAAGSLYELGDDQQLHAVDAWSAMSWHLRSADALDLPLDLELPIGSPLGLREGTLVSANNGTVGVISDGLLRRLWDTREVNAYGYAGKPRLQVPTAAVQGLATGEIAGPLTSYTGGYGRHHH